MGGVAGRSVDAARQSGAGDLPGPGPGGRIAPGAERAVAGEAELAAGAALRPLIDDPADALGESGMADAVEHHLGDGALAFEGFRARLVIDGGGEALQRG